MALKSAENYKAWLDANQDKKDTEQYQQVLRVYNKAVKQGASKATERSEERVTPVTQKLRESGFARGYADPAMGAAEFAQKVSPTKGQAGLPPEAVLAGIRNPSYSDVIGREESLYQANRALQGDEGFDWTRLGGNIASPMSIGSMGVGLPATGATVGRQAVQAAMLGGANAASMPVGADNGYWAAKSAQTGLGMAIPGAGVGALKGAQIAGRPLTRSGAYRDTADFIGNIVGDKKQALIDALYSGKKQIVPGSKPTASQALAKGNIPITQGDDIIAASGSNPEVIDAINQMNVQRAGGPLVRLGRDLGKSATVSDDVMSRIDQQSAAQRQITSSIIREEAKRAGMPDELIRSGSDKEILKAMESSLKATGNKLYSGLNKEMVDPRSYADMLADAIETAKGKSGSGRNITYTDRQGNVSRIGQQHVPAEAGKGVAGRRASKETALQDWGKFKTLESQQLARGKQHSPVPGQPKVPPRYAPQTAVGNEAGLAAGETAEIAKKRLMEETSRIGELQTLLTNTLGASSKSFNKIATKPVVQKALKKAEEWSKNEGVYFPSKQGDKFSVRNLQSIKKEIANYIKNKTSPTAKNQITENQARVLVKVTDELDDFIKSRSRTYDVAQQKYKEAAIPVSRAKVAYELEKKRANAMGKGTPSAYTRETTDEAVRSIKTGTGFSRYKGLEDVFTTEQVNKVKKLEEELIRNGKLDQMIGDINSVLPELLSGIETSLPNALYRPIMAINAGLRRISKHVAPKYEKAAAKIMDNPDELIKVLKGEGPEFERGLIMELIERGAPVVIGQQAGGMGTQQAGGY